MGQSAAEKTRGSLERYEAIETAPGPPKNGFEIQCTRRLGTDRAERSSPYMNGDQTCGRLHAAGRWLSAIGNCQQGQDGAPYHTGLLLAASSCGGLPRVMLVRRLPRARAPTSRSHLISLTLIAEVLERIPQVTLLGLLEVARRTPSSIGCRSTAPLACARARTSWGQRATAPPSPRPAPVGGR